MKKSGEKRESERIWDVVVIGGGAAGMMAAAKAAERGRSVLLLEKNEKLGKKLLISGGGRCNVTNNKPENRTILAKYKEGGKFLFSTFAQFSVKDTFTYFESRAVHLKEENEGRMFPMSNSSQAIWDALVQYMKESGVSVRMRSVVSGIAKDQKTENFKITLAGGNEIYTHACVVATGGTSHPETGSTGEGFKWLKKLGHTIIENNFALVPIALSDAWAKKLGGVTLPDIKLTILSDDKKQSAHTGKLLFTHFGITGPTVLNMSKQVGELLEHSSVTIMLDLFPKVEIGMLRKSLQELLTIDSNKKLKNVLGSMVPAALVTSLLSLANVDGDTPSHSVLKEDRVKIATLLKAVPLHAKGLLGADKAVISAGGVVLTEIDFKTMESRLVPGLYLVGDVLNIDRPSGGYSLQLCWSTGYVAGSHV